MAKVARIMNIDDEQRLLELRRAAKEAFFAWAKADKKAKEAKKVHEAADAEVFRFIDELTDATGKLPFGGDDGDEAEEPAAEAGPPPVDDAPAPEATAPAVVPSTDTDGYEVASDEDRWKFVQVDALLEYGCKPGDVAKLKDNSPPLTTLGEIVEFTKDGTRRLTDIKGIGETANDRIIDALVAYHEANPAKPPKTPADASPPQEDESHGGVAENAAEGEPGAKKRPRRRKRSEPEAETPAEGPQEEPSEPDTFAPPEDTFEPPATEFDPNSDSQRSDDGDDD